MNRKVNKGIWALGLISVCVGVFLLMKLLYDFSGYSGDDYLYHFFYQGEMPAAHLRGIHNPWDLFLSLQNHTRMFNGRFVAHAGVMTAMQFPKAVFNFASAVVFVFVGLLIDLHVFGKHRMRVSYVLLTYGLMWFALPDYGTTVLWLSGAFNYLWLALVYLTFLLPYRFNYHAKHPRLFAVGMAVLGYLAGATNENTAPLTVFIAFAFTLIDWQHSQLAWKWSGGIASIFGFYILLMSGINQIGVRGKQFQLTQLINGTIKYCGLWLVLVAVVVVYLYWQHHSFGHRLVWLQNREFLSGCLYALGAVLGIVALVVSPQISSRVFFGPDLYLVIALLLLLHDHSLLRAGTWIARLLPGLLAICLAFVAIPSYSAAVKSNYQSYQTWATGDAICRHDAKVGIQHAAVPGMAPVFTERNQYWQSTYVANGDPKKRWFNSWMAVYYGLKTVTVNNSLPLGHYDSAKRTASWRLYRLLKTVYDRVCKTTSVIVHADTTNLMRTAMLIYVDEDGRQVGTEPISGNVGTVFNISHASVAGYITKAGNPQVYTFTSAANQSLVIHVKKQAVPAKALLVYQTSNGQRVATEPISGVVGQTIDLTKAGTQGYITQKKAPKSYCLTAAPNQQVIMPVVAQQMGTVIRYVNGKHLVIKVYQTTETGKAIKLVAPIGFQLREPKHKIIMPASGMATLTVPVSHLAGLAALKASLPAKLLIVGLLVVIWDQLAALRKYRDFKLFTKLKRKEHEA